MNQAINEFVQKVSAGGVGVFFFAGHGLQINNQNFLVPVDMDTPRDTADVADQAISVPVLQDKLADAKALDAALDEFGNFCGIELHGVLRVTPGAPVATPQAVNATFICSRRALTEVSSMH